MDGRKFITGCNVGAVVTRRAKHLANLEEVFARIAIKRRPGAVVVTVEAVVAPICCDRQPLDIDVVVDPFKVFRKSRSARFCGVEDGDKSLAQQERIGVIRAIDEDLVVAAARSEHLGHFVRAAVGDRDDVMRGAFAVDVYRVGIRSGLTIEGHDVAQAVVLGDERRQLVDRDLVVACVAKEVDLAGEGQDGDLEAVWIVAAENAEQRCRDRVADEDRGASADIRVKCCIIRCYAVRQTVEVAEQGQAGCG